MLTTPPGEEKIMADSTQSARPSKSADVDVARTTRQAAHPHSLTCRPRVSHPRLAPWHPPAPTRTARAPHPPRTEALDASRHDLGAEATSPPPMRQPPPHRRHPRARHPSSASNRCSPPRRRPPRRPTRADGASSREPGSSPRRTPPRTHARWCTFAEAPSWARRRSSPTGSSSSDSAPGRT